MNYVLTKENKYDGSLSLSFSNNNNIVNQLYDQQLIGLPRYSMYISQNYSMLLLGDYTKEPELAYINKMTSYCNSVDNKCSITGFEYNNKRLDIDSYSIFDTERTSLSIPITDYRVFKKYIFNNVECKIKDNGKVACITPDDYKFPIFKIFISDHEFLIDLNSLANKVDDDFNTEFDMIVDMNNFDTWRLGTKVLNNTLLSYDMNNKKIGFVQDANLEKVLYRLDIYEQEEPSKIGWIVSLGVLLLIVFYFVKFALNYRSKSDIFDPEDFDDRSKLELLKKRFSENKYDYDLSPRENKNIEMNEINKEDDIIFKINTKVNKEESK